MLAVPLAAGALDYLTGFGSLIGILGLLFTAWKSARTAPSAAKVNEAEARMKEYERQERQIVEIDRRLRNANADLDAQREAFDAYRAKTGLAIEAAEKRADEQEARTDDAERRIMRLEDQIRSLGREPVA